MPPLVVSFVPKVDSALSDIVEELSGLDTATIRSLEWNDWPADEECGDDD